MSTLHAALALAVLYCYSIVSCSTLAVMCNKVPRTVRTPSWLGRTPGNIEELTSQQGTKNRAVKTINGVSKYVFLLSPRGHPSECLTQQGRTRIWYQEYLSSTSYIHVHTYTYTATVYLLSSLASRVMGITAVPFFTYVGVCALRRMGPFRGSCAQI